MAPTWGGDVSPGLLPGRLRRFRAWRGSEALSSQPGGGPRAACGLSSPRLALPSFSRLAAVVARSSGLPTELLPTSVGLELAVLQATQECSCGAAALQSLARFVAPVVSASWPIALQALLAADASWSWQTTSQAVSSVAIVSARALTIASGERGW